MKDRKLATRYAKALLAALPDGENQNLADAFLTALASAVSADADLRNFLLDPARPQSAKTSLLTQVADAHSVPDRIKTFLKIVVENGRVADLTSIAAVFHSAREAAQGEVSATLTAAAPLTPELRTRAVAALQKLSGRNVNLTVNVDPSLLGGAVAQVGSMVFDGSLKTQLARLRRTMGQE